MNRFDLKRGWGRAVLLLAVAVFSAGVLSGCEPLRKKFVRKKNADRGNEVIPVLDPVDYPVLERSSLSVYQYHYNLWKVWLKEFVTAMDETASRKQLAGMMEQLDIQLAGMQGVLDGQDNEDFDGFRATLKEVAAEIEEPAAVRDDRALKARVVRVDKDLRLRFGLKVMTEKLEADLDK